MISRRLRLALALLLAATATGCTILDRESYSLVIRKKAHQYERPEIPPILQPGEAAASHTAPVSEADSRAHVRDDLDALIDGLEPQLEAFRPFKYCRLHKSSHMVESVAAVALAPVDYPLTLAATISSYEKQIGLFWIPGEPTASLAILTAAILWEVLKSLLAPPESPPEPPKVESR